MWFLKNKSTSSKNAATLFEVEDIKFLIRCILDSGGSKNLFFAQAHGFSDQSIDEDNLLSYLSAIKSLPQDVTEAGLQNAYELSTSDWGFTINKDVWPRLVNESLGRKNYSRSIEIVNQIEPIISSSSFTDVLKQFDFDFANFISDRRR